MSEIPEGYVRVTELLSAYNGLNKVDPLLLARRADLGKRVHRYCELCAQSMLIEEIDEDCKLYIDSFKKWFHETCRCVVTFEERIFDHGLKITGQYDALMVLNGDSRNTLVDYKIPATANKTWALQTAAYQHIMNSQGGIYRPVNRRGCLMLDRNGEKAKFKEYTDNNDIDIFLGIAKAYRFFNGY